MKNIYIIILITYIFTTGCHHDNCKNAACNYGRVIDETTGEGVPNAKIDLFYKRSSDSWFSSYEYIKSVTSDSKGYYSLTLDSVNVKGRYALKANQSNYFFDDDIVSIVENEGTTIGVNLNMQPKAWLRAHIKNVNPDSEYDRIEVLNKEYRGKNIDTINIFELRGNNSSNTLKVMIYKNLTGHKNFDYVYKAVILDTTDIDIFY